MYRRPLNIEVEVLDGDTWRPGHAIVRDYFDDAWHYRVWVFDPPGSRRLMWFRHPDQLRRLDDDPVPA
jgi:hypothetical protein